MKKRTLGILIAVGVCIIAALAIILVSLLRSNGVLSAPGKTFLQGTTVNGIDVSGMDAEEAAAVLSQRAEDYSFTLKLEEKSYTATGKELELQYNQTTNLQSLLDTQKEDRQQLTFTLDDAYAVDVTGFIGGIEQEYNDQLAQTQAQTEALAAPAEQESQTTEEEAAAPEETAEGEAAEGEETVQEETPVDPNAPQNAYLQYDAAGASFVIVPDQPGKNVDWQRVTEQVQTAVLALEPELTLAMDDLVEQAEVTTEDPKLQAALAEANSYLDLQLTYTFTPDGGETTSETLSRDVLGSLYYVNPEDYTIQVDEEILGNYVNSLVETHSAADKTTKFKTTGGSYININVTEEGQSVDGVALYNDLLECLKNKTGGTRTAPYTAVTDSSEGYWGGNYVEIDLTSQHLWLYRNGECIVSCGVVSGCVANNTRTPTGNFTIFAKNTDRYLNGTNVDGSRYRSWVSYFMPFSGGCGIHDATWRSSFGGDQYLYNGSHGCVGVSLSNAKTIYNNVSVGTHVVVYGGASPDNIPPRTQNISVTASSTNLVIGDQATVSVSSKTTPQFTSSNPAVATVDGSGNVSALAAGSTVITVTCPAGNGYGDATASVTITVSEPAHVHTWQQQTTVIHHEAETHIEKVLVKDAWEETVTTYTCSGCGQVFDGENGKAACQNHIDQAKAEESAGSSSGSSSSSSGIHANATPVEDKVTIQHPAEYEDKVIVDKEAWDETVITGYVCTGCGATKGPNDP